MKKYLALAVLAVVIAGWQSCDKVQFPKEGGSTGPTGNPNAVVRKVLLEDYTGTSCGTCPPAGEMAVQLEGQYGIKLVPVTIHAGFLATPAAPPLNYDFRTTVGTDYYNTFGFSSTPVGMVNRIGFPSSHQLAYSAWGGAISAIINNAPDATIKITNNYNTSTRDLNVSVTSKFLTARNGFYKLVVLLIEDSIFKPQKDDRLPPPSINTNFYHRHVLRAAINGNSTGWGDSLKVGNINVNDSVVKNYVYNIPATIGSWNVNDRQCYVVAFIYNADPASSTRYEMLQAEEKKVR